MHEQEFTANSLVFICFLDNVQLSLLVDRGSEHGIDTSH